MRGIEDIFLALLLGAKQTGDGEVLGVHRSNENYVAMGQNIIYQKWVGMIHYDPLWSNMIHGSDPYKVIIEDWRKVRLGASC